MLEPAAGVADGAFGMAVDWAATETIVAVRGEVDMATSPRLGILVESLIEHGDHELVLDLGDVEFIDAAGVGVIAGAASRLRPVQGHVTVRAASPSAALVLQLTRVSTIVRFEAANAVPRLASEGELLQHPAATIEPGPLADQVARVAAPPADRDVVEAALRLVAALARATIAGADGVSVSLPRHGRLTTVATTDELVATLDGDQYAAGEGPCIEAATEGRWFHVESLDQEQRWPAFVSRARAREMRSILSTPLLTDDRPVGSLNIYGRAARAFAGREQELATIFATEAAGILAGSAVDDSTQQASERLRAALRARESIALAQGVLMERDRLSAADAFAALLQHSRETGEPLADGAAMILDSTQHHG